MQSIPILKGCVGFLQKESLGFEAHIDVQFVDPHLQFKKILSQIFSLVPQFPAILPDVPISLVVGCDGRVDQSLEAPHLFLQIFPEGVHLISGQALGEVSYVVDGFLDIAEGTCAYSRVLRTLAASSYIFSSRFCNLNLVFLSVEDIEMDLFMALSEGNLRSSVSGLRWWELEEAALWVGLGEGICFCLRSRKLWAAGGYWQRLYFRIFWIISSDNKIIRILLYAIPAKQQKASKREDCKRGPPIFYSNILIHLCSDGINTIHQYTYVPPFNPKSNNLSPSLFPSFLTC